MRDKYPEITAVILAGGQARRMQGQDKGLLAVSGKAMIEYLIDGFLTQLDRLVINANRNQDLYAGYGFPVIADNYEGFKGPLAGMASCMKQIDTEFMITAPCDSPLLAVDFVSRMYDELKKSNTDISVADNGERLQPVFCLMRCSLLDSMQNYLDSGERKIDRWFDEHSMSRVDFSDRPETFINVNTPGDLEIIEARLSR